MTEQDGLQAGRDRDLLLPHPPRHARSVRGQPNDLAGAGHGPGSPRACRWMCSPPRTRSTSRRRQRKEQLAIMRLANAETERLRRKFRMTRAQFVRTAAATAIGFWAIDAVRMGKYGNYGFAQVSRHGRLRPRVGPARRAPRACATGPASSSSTSSPTTSTRTRSGASRNPAIHAFFAAVWPQAPRGRRPRPDREPEPLPLPQGAVPRLGHHLHGALVRADLARRRQPAAAGRGGA